MVPLPDVLASNSLLLEGLPTPFTAVFVGATSGVGAATVLALARRTAGTEVKVYLVGRNERAAETIIARCRSLNGVGQFVFLKADVSTVEAVDGVCKEIGEREGWSGGEGEREREGAGNGRRGALNLLFMSQGEAVLDGRETTDGLPLLTALAFYTRVRFASNLLSFLRRASPAFARVVSIGGGTLEGPLDASDFPTRRVSLRRLRGHLTTLITLGLEALAARAPGVSFVHSHPGAVNTRLLTRGGGVLGWVMRALVWLLGWLIFSVSPEECGERQLWAATSGWFDVQEGGKDEAGRERCARGTNGEAGSGMYSIDWKGESAGGDVERLLARYRGEGMVERVWQHVQDEFERIEKLRAGSA